MGGESPINISDLMFDPSIADLLESCASIVGARVFVVDPAGTVVSQSEAGECSCGICSNPPERLESDGAGLLADDPRLDLARRVSDANPQCETVELALG